MEGINPIIKADYPVSDAICVEDTYYILSATMHFMPGGAILRSYDLVNWEIAGYVFENLEGTPEQRLCGEKSCYGSGMCSGCLRYHNECFYVIFAEGMTKKTYLFTAQSVEGPWERHCIEGFYYNPSLFFDDDGRVYMVYGNAEIWLSEMLPDVSGFKDEGLHRLLLKDEQEVCLGYEGSHIYKINGQYSLFVSRKFNKKDEKRTQLCFAADSLTDEFNVRVELDDKEYYNCSAVQVGSPKQCSAVGAGQEYEYDPLYASDDFGYETDKGAHARLKRVWQWNHEPDNSLWSICKEGGLRIRTGKISINLIHAVNTLTQRMMRPRSAAEVTVKAGGVKEGDYAGICVLQDCYGMIAVTRELNTYYLVMMASQLKDNMKNDITPDYMPGTVLEKLKLPGDTVRLRIYADFEDRKETAEFFYESGGSFHRLGGKHKLCFKPDHFAGCRYGLFIYSTKEIGGEAVFRSFSYLYGEDLERIHDSCGR